MAEGDKKVTPKLKPVLDEATKEGLAERTAIAKRRPWFRRQEWFRYKSLSRSGWRRPDGQHSAMGGHYDYRNPVVSIGYGGPRSVRGLHPSGFQEVMVHNVDDLDRIDPKKQAARIAGKVGARKRDAIENEASKRKIRVLNPTHTGGGAE